MGDALNSKPLPENPSASYDMLFDLNMQFTKLCFRGIQEAEMEACELTARATGLAEQPLQFGEEARFETYAFFCFVQDVLVASSPVAAQIRRVADDSLKEAIVGGFAKHCNRERLMDALWDRQERYGSYLRASRGEGISSFFASRASPLRRFLESASGWDLPLEDPPIMIRGLFKAEAVQTLMPRLYFSTVLPFEGCASVLLQDGSLFWNRTREQAKDCVCGVLRRADESLAEFDRENCRPS